VNYYNDIDPKACAWTTELIRAKLIPDGKVDCRSITEVTKNDLAGFAQCHFFNGISGWARALDLAGWPRDRLVWCSSLPCQPFSAAGKGKAGDDERHLWPAFFSLVAQCRPPILLGEQVEAAIGWGWLDAVFADLEAEGYACGAAVLPACSVGAPHIRNRLFWVADANNHGGQRSSFAGTVGKTTSGIQAQESERQRREAIGHGGATGGVAHACQRGSLESIDSGECEARVGQAQSAGDRECAGGVAHAEHDGGRADLAEREAQGRETDGRTGGGLALTGQQPTWRGDRRSREGALAHGERAPDEPGGSGSAGGMGDTASDLQRWKRKPVESDGRESALRGPSAWSDFELIPCADGRARIIKRGLQCLASRLPAGMVPSGDPSIQEVQATAEARVMRLRGYGNSIVAPLAAEFIKAAMSL